MNLTTNIYSNYEFENLQMKVIRRGLQNKIDVTLYLNPSIEWEEMQNIRLELESKK